MNERKNVVLNMSQSPYDKIKTTLDSTRNVNEIEQNEKALYKMCVIQPRERTAQVKIYISHIEKHKRT